VVIKSEIIRTRIFKACCLSNDLFFWCLQRTKRDDGFKKRNAYAVLREGEIIYERSRSHISATAQSLQQKPCSSLQLLSRTQMHDAIEQRFCHSAQGHIVGSELPQEEIAGI
jgi:hypothetical protein